MKHKYHLVLVLLAGVWIGAAVAQEANIERVITQVPSETEATAGGKTGQVVEDKRATQAAFSATPSSNVQLNGVDWTDQQFWLVEMTDLLDRAAVNAAWRDLRTRFPKQMENRTILPRRQDRLGNAGEDSASRYKLFIAKFPEKQMAEEFCAMLRAGQQRCGVASSHLLAGKDVLNVASVPDKGDSDKNTQTASEAESARVKAEQEAEEKARQEAEAKVAKLKAKQEAKAQAERLKAEQKAQAEAEKKAATEEKARQVAEAKAEAARLKAEKKAQAEAEKQAAAETKKVAKAEAARLKVEQEAQTASEAESARVKAEQEAEEKARQEAEAKVAKLKAKQEAKAEAARLKAEQEAKAQAEKQALAEAKAEEARLKAEQKAKAEAEKKAATEEKARQVAEAKAEAARLKAEKKAQAEAEKQAAAETKKVAKAEAARLKVEQEAQTASEAESARVKAEQEAEEKARQEAEARVAKLKAKQEAKAEAARLKAEKKAQAEAEKQAAAEAKKAAKAEVARLKAEQKTKAEAEKLAATASMQVAAVEPEALRPKVEQEVQTEVERAETEKKAKAEERAAAEAKQAAEAESARANAEKKAQVEAQAAAEAEAKAAKLKTPEGMMEDFAQSVERKKAEQKAQAEAKAAEEAQAAKLKAAKSDMMVDFAQKAVLNSPDVLSRWHNFQAAISETAAAEGAFYPHLDMTVDGGRERSQSSASSYSVNTKNTTFTLTQMLHDGFATLNEVRRLNNAQLSRYYELLDASETAALDAVRAFYDVSRQRKLFELTEDNYVRHRTAFEQIKLKVEAGVGRRVDLEQAAGRLALSESNLTLDNANVHDVSARFQRIIGELPPAKIRKSSSQNKLAKKILPNAADALLSVAVESHPAILAAVENVRSSRYDLYGREAKYQPTINLNIAQTHSKNLGGVEGITNNNSAKIMLNWNLFNGGSDSARSAQYAKRLDAARDMRDKACRDIRMNLAIAYNDISKLKEQLNYMDQHQLSIEKARVAYQKQFEIGQRSLLDLLDTENELYQARRSYTNAEYDLAIAYARTLAGMGQLVSSLEISRLETADLPELLGISTDGAENCPPEAPIANNIRKEELDARAVEEARAAIDAARAKEEAEKEKKAKEDEEFLMTPGEAKAKLKKEQETKTPETEPAGLKAEQEVATGGKAKQAVETNAPKNKSKKEVKEKAASTP